MDFIFICVYIENLKQKDVVKGDFFSGLEPSPCLVTVPVSRLPFLHL